jgi:hypothetical protein
MTQALGRVNDEALRTQLGDAARNRFEEMPTIQCMVDRYEHSYSELISMNIIYTGHSDDARL